MIDIEQALGALRAQADPARAEEMAAYHKAARAYLGVANPVIDALARDWREGADAAARAALADALWQTNIHEARIAAAKLLTQARIRDDAPVWATICGWVPDFDCWAVSDHAMIAGQKRLVADPARIETVESWTAEASMWTRRAALVITLPYAKMNFPKPDEQAIRQRVLDWCARYADDRDWFIQKAVAWWVRDLSKHDAAAARAFLDAHGDRLKPWAAREAARHLG